MPYHLDRCGIVFATDSAEASCKGGLVRLPARVERVCIQCVDGAWLLPRYWQCMLSSV